VSTLLQQPTLAGGQPDGRLVEGKVCFPAHQIANPLIISCGAYWRERYINQHSQSTLTSLHAKIPCIMTVFDREVEILAYKKFWSWIEAVMEASGNFIK
jgi:hypothetical protein